MKRSIAKRLHDALTASTEISMFVAGESEQSFLSDRKLQLALERLLTILGEALAQARNEDPTLVETLPEVSQIVGMRNRIVHVYDGVDMRLMWQVVSQRVPDFLPKLEGVLATALIEDDQ